MLITISREYGAGGAEVARRVADILGWRLVDNELVDRVAQRAGLSPEDVKHREERVPGLDLDDVPSVGGNIGPHLGITAGHRDESSRGALP